MSDAENLGVMPHIFALFDNLGVKQIAHRYAGRCFEHKVDDQWWLAINANRGDVKCAVGVTVPPMRIYVEYNGWPAALLDFTGSGEFVMGSAANEATFIAALQKAVAP